MLTLTDCTGKYRMLVFRYGGDVWLKIIDMDGNIKYDFLLEMKRNDKKV